MLTLDMVLTLRTHVYCKCGNSSKEIAWRWPNNSLLVSDKYVSLVLYVKFRKEKHWLVKHFAFLKNICYRVTYRFLTSCWLAHNQLPWNVLLFSCNLIGQLCLIASVTVPCEQRLHFRCVSWRAKSSLCRQPFNFLSCMREIRHAIEAIRKQN